MRSSIMSTRKFKSGDKVKLPSGVVGIVDYYCGFVYTANVYTIKISSLGSITVSEENLTLVEEVTMDRESILKNALEIVMKDRNVEYGSPEDNFKDIAALWSTYKKCDFTAHDVGVMMILLKVSRLMTSPHVEDHYVDIAGYAACGGQAYDKGK